MRSRVFISCGQARAEELDIAHEISDQLRQAGFQPYVALEQQSLHGIEENIFSQLRTSEYFIFIDFKREKLKRGEHRGSLFSHQELAIATFLGLEVLTFQEEGVVEHDGFLKFVQANPTAFADRRLLPSAVIHAATNKRKWNPNWRNSLTLERRDSDFEDVFSRDGDLESRYFHIRVKNNHKAAIANDCIVYLESIFDKGSGDITRNELVEFKWKGLKIREAAIPPRSYRFLDAARVNRDSLGKAWLAINQNIVDRKGLHKEYSIQHPGVYDLTFVVFSKNFSPARRVFRLSIRDRLEDIEMKAP